MRIVASLLVLITLEANAAPAYADAARISAGGAAHQMQGGGTVSMVSEVVKIAISNHVQKVDCTFNFENKGPACSVRIGFPDFSNMPDLTSEKTASNPTTNFLTFKRLVDGEESKTELVPGDSDYGGTDQVKLWHASDVKFAAAAKITVRDCYSQLPDISPTDMEGIFCKPQFHGRDQ